MDAQQTIALDRQTVQLKRIADALERANQLLFYMVPSDQRAALQKEDATRATQKMNRPDRPG